MSSKNSAERLHDLVVKMRQQPANKTVGDTWAKILDIPRTNVVELLRQIAQVMLLYAETKAAVTSLQGVRQDLLIKCFPKIESAFSVLNLDAPWNTVLQHLDELTAYQLDVCAHELSRAGFDVDVPVEELDKLRAEVTKLIDRTVKSSLSSNFKTFLIKYLRLMENALLDYRITGAEGLVDALERALGAMHLSPDAVKDVAETDEGSVFWEVVQKVSQLASIAVNAGKAAGYVLRILPGIKDTTFTHTLLLDK